MSMKLVVRFSSDKDVKRKFEYKIPGTSTPHKVGRTVLSMSRLIEAVAAIIRLSLPISDNLPSSTCQS